MINYFWLTASIFVLVFVVTALSLTLLISKYTIFKVLPIPIQEVKAVKNNAPPSPLQALATQDGNQFIRTSSSSQPNTCINYNTSTRTITINCSSPARLTDIDNKLKDTSVLIKQSSDGIWFLRANIVIAKGATLSIDSTDTKWLKISSGQTIVSTISHTSALPYNIDVHGSLKINSVKITSWDPTTNNYAITNGSREAVPTGTKGATTNGYIIHFGAPRAFIKIEHDATGSTDITNSELAYLGYESGSTSSVGSGGLNYYGADGSVIRGNNIHDLYFGFYSSGVSGFIIENNQIYHNANYGVDPHTGTHDMVIRQNIVHDNGAQGIICSLNCFNILIEDNQLYRNGKAAIMFSRNMSNSVARNNIISNEVDGILVSQSNNNKIYNNTISNSQYGINVIFGSSGNTFYSNLIKNCLHGIYSQATSNNNNNTFYNNHIINSPTASGAQDNQPSFGGANSKGVKVHSRPSLH
ncbi:MAG TPA: right-handed parallel beta-helix repeat-containing protein [Candidatus Nitrosopolaris sp.]|nr:right-handed parallel beta-helix repeat-containing protein [Candidatus Nitrosopolaris sp.]